jgi:Holliday junction resolvase-like predicted endonuclease
MLHKDNSYKKNLGFKGETCVIDKLKTMGFVLYKRNIKKQNSEIDIIVYRHNVIKNNLDIRIIEVKTRSKPCFDLLALGMDKKWRLIRPYFYEIKSEVSNMFKNLNYSEVHFDIAIVVGRGDDLHVCRYIKDVNLFL